MKIWDRKISELNMDQSKQELLSAEGGYTISLICFDRGQIERRHVHRIINEVFFVLGGRIDIIVDDCRYTLESGQMVYLEAGDIHSLENVYQEEARLLQNQAGN